MVFSLVAERKRITVRPRRIFATTLTRRPVTTVFLTRPKGGNSAKSWAQSIATSVSEKKEKRTSKKKFSALWAFHKTWMKLLWAIQYFVRGVKAHEVCAVRALWQLGQMIENVFFRLHNFNSNSEYYINPVDGINTNLVPSCQTPTFEGRSLPVEICEREIQEEPIKQKTPTQNEFLDYCWFNLSNQIMNHTTPNDFIELSSCGS